MSSGLSTQSSSSARRRWHGTEVGAAVALIPAAILALTSAVGFDASASAASAVVVIVTLACAGGVLGRTWEAQSAVRGRRHVVTLIFKLAIAASVAGALCVAIAFVAGAGWPTTVDEALETIGGIAWIWAVGLAYFGLPSLIWTIPLSVVWLVIMRMGEISDARIADASHHPSTKLDYL